MTGTGDTLLGKTVSKLSEGKGSLSGFSPLADGLDAFAARAQLTMLAERSIDVQYYIWHADDVGNLLSAALIKAAERGVRIRVLIDDVGLGAPDEGLFAVDAHPNIEIRLFNPVVNRGMRMLESVFSFSRINRRMHNKSFTVDNQITIVGGRNVGNEYYSADPDVNFNDFDVLAAGPVVQEVSGSFDKYWNSEFAIPVTEIIKDGGIPLAQVLEKVRKVESGLGASPYIQAVKSGEFAAHVKNHSLPLYWGEAHVVYDDPEKLRHSTDQKQTHLLTRLNPLIGKIEKEFIIVSPYFIPGKKAVADMGALIKQGVSVKILTNSLAATDVGAVYSGYANYRIPLLQAGTELYEAKPDPEFLKQPKQKTKTHFGSSSRASLHSKVYIFDRKKVFVGSLNLDPRSVDINTELGILFENHEFAGRLGGVWDSQIKDFGYQLTLQKEQAWPDESWDTTETATLLWLEHLESQIKTYDVEPHTGFWRSFGITFLGILPIEHQL
jgi:putative cardiolipin synthase